MRLDTELLRLKGEFAMVRGYVWIIRKAFELRIYGKNNKTKNLLIIMKSNIIRVWAFNGSYIEMCQVWILLKILLVVFSCGNHYVSLVSSSLVRIVTN
jgi:hypothetical protein